MTCAAQRPSVTCSSVVEDTQYSTSADLSHHPLSLLSFCSAASAPLAGPETEGDTLGIQLLFMSELRDMATLLQVQMLWHCQSQTDTRLQVDVYGHHITKSTVGL